MNTQRLCFAASAFLQEMARRANRTGSGAEVPSLDQYSSEQATALLAAVEKAIQATEPTTDHAFMNWLIEQKDKRLP